MSRRAGRRGDRSRDSDGAAPCRMAWWRCRASSATTSTLLWRCRIPGLDGSHWQRSSTWDATLLARTLRVLIETRPDGGVRGLDTVPYRMPQPEQARATAAHPRAFRVLMYQLPKAAQPGSGRPTTGLVPDRRGIVLERLWKHLPDAIAMLPDLDGHCLRTLTHGRPLARLPLSRSRATRAPARCLRPAATPQSARVVMAQRA